MSFDIPVLDFGKFLHGSDEEKQEIAKNIDEAFRKVGFVYLKNHGVPKEMVDKAFEWVGSLSINRYTRICQNFIPQTFLH